MHVRDAVLGVARGAAGAPDDMTIGLADVIVTPVALADTPVDAQPPVETAHLGFADVEHGCRPQEADGSLGAAVESRSDPKKPFQRRAGTLL